MNDVPHDTPSEVRAKNGAVEAKGPDKVSLTFTPEAAFETAHRLTEAAVIAKGEQSVERKQL